MKTPMQELFNRLDEMSNKYLDEYNRLSSPYTDGVAAGIDYAMQIIESLIEKEKEVIQRAYKQGVVDEYGDTIDLDTITEAEEYYNRIFNGKDQ